jgi:hypothetical protein
MARLANGVFGPLAGKLGGVVFGSWKGINYGRAYVVPANPQTPSQQTQRTKMGDCVAWARPIKDSVLNRYYGFNLVKRSAFNQFVSQNISLFDGSPAYADIVLGVGNIQSADFASLSYSSGSHALTASWSTTVEWDGLATDKIDALAYNSTKNTYSYISGSPLRSTGSGTIPLTGEEAGDTVYVYLIAYRVVDGVVVASATPSANFNVLS